MYRAVEMVKTSGGMSGADATVTLKQVNNKTYVLWEALECHTGQWLDRFPCERNALLSSWEKSWRIP
jgi:hypothetical protein